MKYFSLILLLLSFQSHAQWYVEVSVGMTDEINSQPEIKLISPLGRFAIGYEAKYDWSIEFTHISSIQQDEIGLGLNTFWISKRLYFN